MPPPHHHSDPPPPLAVRSARRVAHTLRSPAALDRLAWLIWLLAVAGFAIWTQLSYRAPSRPAWVGMTIRTTAFAAWALVIREWVALRIHHSGRLPDDQGHRHDDDARPRSGHWR